MPLHTAQDPSQIQSFSDVGEQFLVFYSSRDDAGRMWCPDCRDVEDLVERTFASADGPSALIIYVGQRNEWRETPSNTFRGEPWNVQSIPTIIRVTDSQEDSRLVENEIPEKLASFVQK
ncbi:hypothetical protein DENSPDRAFT_833275 [Dentipellis sp. KUC8613]|nr:hypothetical protein DENSPDRAFT_833275 [Dentipellis sp. KUC8613]